MRVVGVAAVHGPIDRAALGLRDQRKRAEQDWKTVSHSAKLLRPDAPPSNRVRRERPRDPDRAFAPPRLRADDFEAYAEMMADPEVTRYLATAGR